MDDIMSKYIHYSIDDTIQSFKQLTELKPASIFEIRMFAFLKELHSKYGIVVSCYCFYKYGDFSLKDCTHSYRKEFEQNSSWLRFGFHGYSGEEDYGSQDLESSCAQYALLLSNLIAIVGEHSIDIFPRIHTFHATQEFISYMHSYPQFPIIGLLSADDDRVSYSMNMEQCQQLVQQGRLDFRGVKYLRTTQRFDSLKLKKIRRLFAYTGGQVVLFTHEWVFYPKSFKMRVKAYLIKRLMMLTASYYTKKCYIPSFSMDKY